MPIGAYAAVSDERRSTLTAIVVSIDGARAARAEARGAVADAAAIGARAAEQLLARGAGRILADVDTARGAVEGLQP